MHSEADLHYSKKRKKEKKKTLIDEMNIATNYNFFYLTNLLISI